MMYMLKQNKNEAKIRNSHFNAVSAKITWKHLNAISMLSVVSLSTRKASFGKTVEASGRTLIGKQGEDLFFFGDNGPRTNVISKIRGSHLVFNVFYSNFAPLRLIFLKTTANHDLQRKNGFPLNSRWEFKFV